MSARQAGFTLLELLVGIALMAMIAVLLVGSLNLSFRGAETVQARAEAFEERGTMQGFLRRQIEAAEPVGFREENRFRIAFEGRADRLDFATGMAGRGGSPGGLWLVRLQVERLPEGERLTLTRRLFTAGPQAFDFSGPAERAALLDGASIRFAYWDGRGWREAWEEPEALPGLVRLSIDGGEDPGWPDLVVALRIGRGDR